MQPAPAKAPTPAEIEAAQLGFNWLLPVRKQLLTTGEAAKYLGREVDFVRALVESGGLEAHQDTALGERKSSRVTRRSVLLRLMRSANYRPENFLRQIIELLETFPPEDLRQVAQAAEALRQRKLAR
jgi:excisionase family DNA binding protein